MSHVAVENALSLDQQVRDGPWNAGGGEAVREAAPLTGGWRRTGAGGEARRRLRVRGARMGRGRVEIPNLALVWLFSRRRLRRDFPLYPRRVFFAGNRALPLLPFPPPPVSPPFQLGRFVA